MDPRKSRYMVLFLFLLAAPAVMWLVYHLKTPVLYAGDKLETRDCRDCGGGGKNVMFEAPPTPMGDRCPICGGTGKVRVIIPGGERPTKLRGAVAPADEISPLHTYRTVRPVPGVPRPTLGLPGPKRLIGGAEITFRSAAGDLIETKSNPVGLFTTRLPPGAYKVSIVAPGFKPVLGKLKVTPLTEPIWLELGNVVRPPESYAEAMSLYGLEMLAALAKEGPGQGWVSVNAGGP